MTDRALTDRAALEAPLRELAVAGRWADLARQALAIYGDEVLGYLVAVTRDGTLADDAFSLFLEDIWTGLPGFRWECSFRTWAYTLARHALVRLRRRERPWVPIDAIADVAALYRTRTATFLRTETKDKLAEVRAALDPDDQTLLILRLNRGLAWREIARVLPDADRPEPTSETELARRAAALRKRFARLKDELRDRLAARG